MKAVVKEYYDTPYPQLYWYRTTHGVQPGSVPKGIDIFHVFTEPDGVYFVTDKILTTDALNKYDIKEDYPEGINYYKYIDYTPGSVEDGIESDDLRVIIVPGYSVRDAMNEFASIGIYPEKDQLEKADLKEFRNQYVLNS